MFEIEKDPIPSEVQTQLIVLERLMDFARKPGGDDPKALAEAVEKEILRNVIYRRRDDPDGDGVRAVRVELAKNESVVVVIVHICSRREEKVPFLAFFEYYRPVILV